jgi:hypothetical protein
MPEQSNSDKSIQHLARGVAMNYKRRAKYDDLKSLYCYRSIGYGASRVSKSTRQSRAVSNDDAPKNWRPVRMVRTGGTLSFGATATANRPALASSPLGFRGSPDAMHGPGHTTYLATTFRR